MGKEIPRVDITQRIHSGGRKRLVPTLICRSHWHAPNPLPVSTNHLLVFNNRHNKGASSPRPPLADIIIAAT
ncbi:hypothetical protein AMTR_s00065p00090400 [Amborella trichopoda]|uniref:Uncharacterized protein n=1 Tax=Amborella trichopoda TaxID=13333 RepID=U5CZ02_AMBTC|nr:hypothetical protein AMTR_s00065p00090400 [Amborella trichopoda]